MSNYRTLFEVGKFLFEIGKSLFAETDIRKLLPLAMDKVIEYTRAQRGMIIVYAEHGELLFQTARDQQKKDIPQPEAQTSTTIIQQVRQTGQSVVLKNALEDPGFKGSSSIPRLRLLSVACAPLRHEGEIFGAIYIDNRDVTALFDEETGKLLSEFAELISVAVKNALERRRLEFETSQKDLKLLYQNARRHQLEEQLAKSAGYDEIKGLKSLVMLEVFNQVEKVAGTDSSVLIIGETGAGKELVARALHRNSKRSEQTFVTLNCAAFLNEELLISELFGHTKGAFTGADKDKAGYFETADGSTIFLDEIAKSSTKFQALLLRVLETGEFQRLGETKLRRTDVRIFSAASLNLPELMQKGEFLPDLYYRLESFVIRMPSLRERQEDLGEIAEYFLKKFAAEHQRRVSAFSAEALELLAAYHWPGNVRELRNAVNRAVILAEEEMIHAEDLPIVLQAAPSSSAAAADEINFMRAKQKVIEDFEKEFLSARLRETQGNISEAARRCGMHKKNFIEKMKQYDMERENYLQPDDEKQKR